MNRESAFVQEITKGTEQGKIRWSNISPSAFAEYIFQSPFVYQAFTAQYRKTDRSYKLLLVNKKFPSHNTDYDVMQEQHRTELLVLSEGKLIFTFTDYEVEAENLGQLSTAVERKNDDVNELFA